MISDDYRERLTQRIATAIGDACTAQDDANGARVYFLDGPSTPEALAAELVGLVAAPMADLDIRRGALCDVLGIDRGTAPYDAIEHASVVRKQRDHAEHRVIMLHKLITGLFGDIRDAMAGYSTLVDMLPRPPERSEIDEIPAAPQGPLIRWDHNGSVSRIVEYFRDGTDRWCFKIQDAAYGARTAVLDRGALQASWTALCDHRREPRRPCEPCGRSALHIHEAGYDWIRADHDGATS